MKVNLKIRSSKALDDLKSATKLAEHEINFKINKFLCKKGVFIDLMDTDYLQDYFDDRCDAIEVAESLGCENNLELLAELRFESGWPDDWIYNPNKFSLDDDLKVLEFEYFKLWDNFIPNESGRKDKIYIEKRTQLRHNMSKTRMNMDELKDLYSAD